MSTPAFVTFDTLRAAAETQTRSIEDQKTVADTSAPSPVSVAYQQRQARSNLDTMLAPRSEVLRLGSLVGNLCTQIITYAPLDPPRDPLPKGVNETQTFPVTLSDGNDPFWSTESTGKGEIATAMGNVFLALFVAANACGVDLRACILKKMVLNGKKYPVQLCKGKSGKYTEYSSHTGITTDHSSQSTVDMDHPEETEDEKSPSNTNTVQGLTLRIRQFASDRLWSRYHTPRNIALAMMGELGELAEVFQWRGDAPGSAPAGLVGWSEKDKDHVSQELADVSIYLLRLADVCGVDLGREALNLAAGGD